jgi:peptide/nickel transport system ATP-binding protein
VSEPAVRAEGLRVELLSGTPIVEDLDLSIARGQTLGLVGESGSGKTTVALALLGYRRAGVKIAGGRVTIAGETMVPRVEREVRRLRGRLVSYVPQEPGMALNPSMRVGEQLRAMLRFHAPSRQAGPALREALEWVELPSDEQFLRRFPHQLSGGQQQRVAIAIALICRPVVAVLDEPTTGLDVLVQAGLLAGVRRLREESRLTMVYVSHDLAVVASIADRIAVMYAGRVVEEGPTAELIRAPRHPYTRGLIEAVPDPAKPRRLQGIPGVAMGVGGRLPGCPFAPRCSQRVPHCDRELPALEPSGAERLVRCFEWKRTPPLVRLPPQLARLERDASRVLLEAEDLAASHRGRRERVTAAAGVSFAIERGESVALVGESGSGKTTIARCIAGLHRPDAGRILLDGASLAPLAAQRSVESRRRIQIVFQNPYDSLNPRHTIGDAIARPARLLRGLSRAAAPGEVASALERVRLPAGIASRYPPELSGGERQRVAIARALAAEPDLLICDEVTSALDVSVQAAVLELIADLRTTLGLSVLFISHDLGVVACVCDRVIVLRDGVVREQGPAGRVLAHPSDPYTIQLVSAAPAIARGDEDTDGYAMPATPASP